MDRFLDLARDEAGRRSFRTLSMHGYRREAFAARTVVPGDVELLRGRVSRAKKPLAMTATPEGTCDTLTTPGTAFALSALKLDDFAAKHWRARDDHGSEHAGNVDTSRPNCAVPFVFDGVSRRWTGLPIMREFFVILQRNVGGRRLLPEASAQHRLPKEARARLLTAGRMNDEKTFFCVAGLGINVPGLRQRRRST